MKKKIFIIKKYTACLITMLLCAGISPVNAQDDTSVHTLAIKSRGLQRVGNTFESVWLIDNQTVEVPFKKVLEFDILHRFGTIDNGYKDVFGLFAPSNIKLGIGYTPIKNLMVNIGLTKDHMIWDFSLKYALLRQKHDGMPVSVTYFGNAAMDSREKENFMYDVDRLSYFHQLMVARKLSRDISVQASFNMSHFNNVEGYINSKGEAAGKMNNTHLSFSMLGRYKISDALSFIANYDQPLTQHPANNPNPNLSAGLEVATPLHAFQVFLGNYRWMVPQYNNVYNNNNFEKGAFVIGFNITRLIDLQEEDLKGMIMKPKKKTK